MTIHLPNDCTHSPAAPGWGGERPRRAGSPGRGDGGPRSAALARAVVAALALAGCGDADEQAPVASPSAEAPSAVHSAPKRAPQVPTCSPTVGDEGEVTVAGLSVGLKVPTPDTLVTLGAGAGRILLARRATSPGPPATAEGRLYEAHCAGMPPPRLALERPGADFGSAVEAPDGRALYFTDATGAWALPLGDRQLTPTRLTTPPALDEGCWRAGDEAARAARRDVVRAVDPDTGALLLERGAPCGYGGTWVSTPVWLMDPADPANSPLVPVHQASTVAADAAGRLWLGDAGRCHEPGPRDDQTPGAIFRSDDAGVSWRRVPVVAVDAAMSTPAAVIRADAKRKGYLVVLSARCTSAAGTYGGQLYATRDSGATWQRLVLPREAGLPSEEGPSFTDVARVAGSVDRLHVWGEGDQVWRTNSSGLRWKRGVADVPPAPPRDMAKLGGAIFQATPRGLVRVAADGKETVVFPTGAVAPPLPQPTAGEAPNEDDGGGARGGRSATGEPSDAAATSSSR